MAQSKQRSRYEAALAVAHRALWRAADVADELGDEGAVEDLAELQRYLAVMVDDSLRGRKRPRRQVSI